MENNVFIVDDDEQMRSLITDSLSTMSLTVTPFENARALYSEFPARGILILDLVMPDVDGIEVLQRLGKANSRLQIILISGLDSTILACAKDIALGEGLTLLGTLNKPFSISELLAVVRKSESVIQA